MTIYLQLKRKLGREPTHRELMDEVARIKAEALVEAAEKGKTAASAATVSTTGRRLRGVP
jgi:hypothetical protein